MTKCQNKIQLQRILKEEMQRNIVDQNYDVIYCEADTCTNLKTSVQSDMFVFNNPEAD